MKAPDDGGTSPRMLRFAVRTAGNADVSSVGKHQWLGGRAAGETPAIPWMGADSAHEKPNIRDLLRVPSRLLGTYSFASCDVATAPAVSTGVG